MVTHSHRAVCLSSVLLLLLLLLKLLTNLKLHFKIKGDPKG